MAYTDTLPRQRSFGQTVRPDAWWLQPLLVFLGFSAFIVYSTWAAFQGVGDIHNHACSYWYGGNGANYLSPFYSPEIWGTSPHAILGAALPSWWPAWAPFSPAFLILWIPAGFRFTCYYYRGAYYKAFWADPISCTVGEPRNVYRGENSFPLIIQNIHRYFFYLAAVFILFLAFDVWKALWFEDPATHKVSFGLGIGTLVLAVNVVLLGGYTFGCHSFRHLIGGGSNHLSKNAGSKQAYHCVSCLNRRHMNWAWMSLFWVGFTDLYIRLCATHVWSDWRIF